MKDRGYREGLSVPRHYKPPPGVGLVREQDVDGLAEALERAGKKVPVEADEQGLTIQGYG